MRTHLENGRLIRKINREIAPSVNKLAYTPHDKSVTIKRLDVNEKIDLSSKKIESLFCDLDVRQIVISDVLVFFKRVLKS